MFLKSLTGEAINLDVEVRTRSIIGNARCLVGTLTPMRHFFMHDRVRVLFVACMSFRTCMNMHRVRMVAVCSPRAITIRQEEHVSSIMPVSNR